MTAIWFALFICVFADQNVSNYVLHKDNMGTLTATGTEPKGLFQKCAFGIEHHIGKHPRRSDYKIHHPSLKIINGKKAPIAKYPYVASLQISQSEFGSAVILNNNYLLTTAFNVVWAQIEELQFRVGSNSASSKGQVLNAAEVHIHPNYTGSWDYDIAVVKTDKLISFSKKAKPIKIATTELKAKTAAKVIGWGETTYESNTTSKFLQVGDVTVLDHTQCAKTYNSDLTDRLMCTLDKKQGPCEYDFGDPLVANTQLYGLFAGGYDCKPGNPVLYTDIPNLSSWVNSIVPSTQH